MPEPATFDTPLPIVVDPEFATLLPRMEARAYVALQQDMKKHGCLQPLAFWEHEGQLILLDGHVRYHNCQYHYLNFDYVLVEGLESREDAIVWILQRALARRNLSEEAQAALRRQYPS